MNVNWDEYVVNAYKVYPWILSKRTKKEVRFIVSCLRAEGSKKILDVACGYGRHTIELSRKGYRVDGLDISKKAVLIARQEAKEKQVNANFYFGDIRKFEFDGKFDAAFNIFASFGYYENERENLKVLKQVFKILKKSGIFILDTVNRDSILNKSPQNWWYIKEKNTLVLTEDIYNALKGTISHKFALFDNAGYKEQIITLKLYACDTLCNLLYKAGFKIEKVYGDLDRSTYNKNSPRLIIIARKAD